MMMEKKLSWRLRRLPGEASYTPPGWVVVESRKAGDVLLLCWHAIWALFRIGAFANRHIYIYIYKVNII